MPADGEAICPVVEAVRQKMKDRALFGFLKYKTTMMRDDQDLEDWLRLAQEEAMDFCIYLERIQIMLKEGK